MNRIFKSRNIIIIIALISLMCSLPALCITVYMFSSASTSSEDLTLFYFFLIMGFLALVLSLVLWGFWFGTYINEKNASDVNPNNKNGLSELADKRIKDIVDKPEIIFHFVDRNKIETSYNDYFREPVHESFSKEIANNNSRELLFGISKGPEGKVGKQVISTRTDNMRMPPLSLEAKFRRYLKAIILDNLVHLNLELVEVDSSDLQSFNEKISEFKSLFDLSLDNIDEIEEKHKVLRETAVQKTIDRLEQSEGANILISGQFSVTERNGIYRFTYVHPINDYLIMRKDEIKIVFDINKNHIEPSVVGNYAPDNDALLKVNVYGKVSAPLDISRSHWKVRIDPRVVYK